MDIEVVDARPQGARVVRVTLPAGATLRDALTASGFELDLERQAFGIFGKRVALDARLSPGDRVEIYRPLAMDPKEARRRRSRRRR
ncbi:MAG TPA: RnfH family protein [Burkholderiales bacterium]|nr:RnfH family protein [Burkholderiales bacterium]